MSAYPAAGLYSCPSCEWMGDSPQLSPYHIKRCPECGTEVNVDE